MRVVGLVLLLVFVFAGCASNPRVPAQHPASVAPAQNPAAVVIPQNSASAAPAQSSTLTPAISAQLQSCIARQRNLDELRERASGLRDRLSVGLVESGFKRDCGSLMKQYGPSTATSTAAAPSAGNTTPAQMCERFSKWLGQGPYAERAGFTPSRTAYEQLRTSQLLQDEFFSPAFGRPYDRFSLVEIDALRRQALSCDTSVSMGNDKGHVLQVFSIDANARNVATVTASRPAAAELDGVIQSLNDVQKSDDPAGMLRDLEAVANPLAKTAPGANAIAFYDKVAAIQLELKAKARDLESIAQRAKLEKQIETGSTLADLQNLDSAEKNLIQSWPKLSAQSDATQWGSLRDKLQAKIHALSTPLAAEELASYRTLEKSGDSLDTMRALTNRDADITNRLGSVLSLPS